MKRETPATAAKPKGGSLQNELKKAQSVKPVPIYYDYVDREGKLIHQTVRLPGKKFFQRRPAPDNGVFKKSDGQEISAQYDYSELKWWFNTLDGIEPVLYHLPSIPTTDAEDSIFICEGEKDADNLEESGAITTTAPMGACKWRDSYTQVLHHRDIIICPDRDKAGAAHADLVAAKLYAAGCSVRIVNWEKIAEQVPALPKEGKQDVSDLISLVGSADEAKAILEKCADQYQAPDVGGVGQLGDLHPKVPQHGPTGMTEGGRACVYLPGRGEPVGRFAAELGRKIRELKVPIFKRGGLVQYLDGDKLFYLPPVRFRTELEQHFCLVRRTKDGGEIEGIMHDDLARLVLASPQFQKELWEIRRVNPRPMPVMTGGELRLLPQGYDAQEKILTIGGGSIEEMPLPEAVAVIDEFTADVAYLDDDGVSKARHVSLMLTVFGDCLLSPTAQRPVGLMTGNREGLGKGTAAEMAIVPVHGKANASPPPTKGQDMTPMLTAAVIEAKSILFFDNWKIPIEGAALEAFVTATDWTARILGKSETFSGPKECLIFITANHAKLGPDMARRCLPVSLFVREALAAHRHISKAMTKARMISEAPRVLGALWAILRQWHAGRAAFCPSQPPRRDFPEWSEIFPVAVEMAGWKNPLEETTAGMAESYRDMLALVRLALAPDAGEAVRFEKVMMPVDVEALARANGLFPSILSDPAPECGSREARSETQRFFRGILGKAVGCSYEGVTVSSHGAGDSKRYTFRRE